MRILFFVILIILNCSLFAQYAPQADVLGTTAISKDSSIIVSWATAYQNYNVGTEVDITWQTPEKALGAAQGTSGDIVCLGRGGTITFSFDTLIVNGEGPDFTTFENALSHTFLELGWVEVSMDGINFERFPNHSHTVSPISAFGNVDPTKINGYCSKYLQGFGTPFDLDSVSLDTIRFVRLIDIVGDGNSYDSESHPIYDPYATTGSAGLDIDAIGVINAGTMKESISEIAPLDFRIYPNPAKDFLIIEGITNQSIKIFDLRGRVVKQIVISGGVKLSQPINISNLEQGIYFLKLETKQANISKKLIIKR